ncbi:MAG: cyclic nucleotide-binding domain-containing protein [Bacteroidaceae bacterium]|nr:cyclic nucleotide-binding domain-containing protein [Bacteroidaceae bacterium]MBR6845652.1 cyclic nucleotide-binding domain-containing protein [Bacteroidaceae bacterium]
MDTRDVAREIARRYCRLEPASIEKLSELLIPMKFMRGDIILKEGEECKCMYYVERGMVRQYYFKNGKDVTEHFSFEGRIVWCIESLLTHKPSQITIEALETSYLYALPRKELFAAIDTCPELGILYRKITEHALISSQHHADSQRFENAQERYERLLSEKPEIILRAPMIHVASFLQMTPETLSRVRANHEKK